MSSAGSKGAASRLGSFSLVVAAILLSMVCAPTTRGSDEGRSEAKLSNTIRWTTASEVDNFGYDVYRGDTQEGPFERITPRPLAGAGTTDIPQQYAYVDDTIEEGKSYYYYVESISLDGERERFTPVFASKPKYRTE